MKKDIKEIVLNARKEGKVVVLTFDGFRTIPLEALVEQPIEELLYDLNRSEEVILNFMDDPKWINDFACAQVIRYLKNKLENTKEKL